MNNEEIITKNEKNSLKAFGWLVEGGMWKMMKLLDGMQRWWHNAPEKKVNFHLPRAMWRGYYTIWWPLFINNKKHHQIIATVRKLSVAAMSLQV